MMKLCLKFATYLVVASGFLVVPTVQAQSDVAVQRAINVDDDRTVRRWLAAGGDHAAD